MVILNFGRLKKVVTETLDTVKGIYSAAYVLMMNVGASTVDPEVRTLLARANAELLELQNLLKTALHILSCVKGVKDVGGPEDLKATIGSTVRKLYDTARRFTMLRTSDSFTRLEVCMDMGYNGALIEEMGRETPRLYQEKEVDFTDNGWWVSVPGLSPCKLCANLRYADGPDAENRCDENEVNCVIYRDWQKWNSCLNTD